MSEIYKNTKRGYKVNIGQEIGNRCRQYVFAHGWDIDNEVITDIASQVYRFNHFAAQATYGIEDHEAVAEFQELITDKVRGAFEKFAEQPASGRQIYYYISLCDYAGEEYEQITNNKEIQIEISRLIKLKEQQEQDLIQGLKENKEVYEELQAEGII